MAIIYPKNFDLSIIESHSEAEYIVFREFLKLDKEKQKTGLFIIVTRLKEKEWLNQVKILILSKIMRLIF